jgi:hypothetical protein
MRKWLMFKSPIFSSACLFLALTSLANANTIIVQTQNNYLNNIPPGVYQIQNADGSISTNYTTGTKLPPIEQSLQTRPFIYNTPLYTIMPI